MPHPSVHPSVRVRPSVCQTGERTLRLAPPLSLILSHPICRASQVKELRNPWDRRYLSRRVLATSGFLTHEVVAFRRDDGGKKALL